MITEHPEKTVYLVDDDFAVRDSLTLLIESSGLSVKSFDSAQAFLDNYKAEQISCLLLDFLMPSMNGLDLQQELKSRDIDIPIIFISGHGNIPISSKAFRNGAVDFLEKPLDDKILLERINQTLKQVQFNWKKKHYHHEVQELYAHLTVREKEVMKLIAKSHSNKEAARILGISNRTIDVHRAHVMEKMKSESLADLIIKAVICGIV
jgi:FixJ family two-component response regulator